MEVEWNQLLVLPAVEQLGHFPTVYNNSVTQEGWCEVYIHTTVNHMV